MDTTAPRHTQAENRSLIALFSDLFRETSTLVHQEAELAKAEISEKVSEVGKGIAALAIGGAILIAGFMLLLFRSRQRLAMMLPEEHANWLAPLIVASPSWCSASSPSASASASSPAPPHTLAHEDSLRQDGQLSRSTSNEAQRRTSAERRARPERHSQGDRAHPREMDSTLTRSSTA